MLQGRRRTDVEDVPAIQAHRRYGAIACAVPYLALKIVWLAGGTLGVADRAMMSDPSRLVMLLVLAERDAAVHETTTRLEPL